MAEPDSAPEKTTVNIRMTEPFLEDIDTAWQAEGYNSRSEFVRDLLRDAIKHPEFNRADLKAIAASEVQIQEGRTHTSDEVTSALGLAEADE